MTTYTIRNDFHNSECQVRGEIQTDGCGDHWLELSPSQSRRVRRELCGVSECHCQHGTQHADDGIAFHLNFSE